jgi:hypothetical protein
MLYVILRPMPSPTKYRVSKVVALATSRQEAQRRREEDGDELWFVHGARWFHLEEGEVPTVDGQLPLF